MNIAEIKKLPMREKFQIMEALWDEMRVVADKADVPESHRLILDERREAVESGSSSLLDWDEVKDNIGRDKVIE